LFIGPVFASIAREDRTMGDDDALAILYEIAADPTMPLHMQVEAKDAADACAERDVRSCREVIALLISVLARTRDPKEAQH
jgi:hypothetical protein